MSDGFGLKTAAASPSAVTPMRECDWKLVADAQRIKK